MKKLALLPIVTALLSFGACSHFKLHSALPQNEVRVRELGSQELGQGVFEDAGPPQSSVAPIFLDNDNMLIVTMGGGIEVRDVKSLGIRWRLPVRIGVSAEPLIVGSSVVVAGMDAVVRKLRLSTGQVEWTSKLPAESSGGMTSSQGLLFITAGDDSLSAIDEKTGSAVWSYKRPTHEGNVLWSLRGSAVPVHSPDGKTVYSGFSDGAFVALEATSGKTLWERNFDRSGRFKDVDTPPILSTDGSVLYVSIVDGDLVALRTRDGSTLWSVPGAAATAPLVRPEEKALYLSTRDDKVIKVSLEDTRILWTSSLGVRGMGSQPVSMLNAFIAVTTTHSGLVILDAKTGELLWEESYAIGSAAPPSFDGKRLATISARNVLHLYSVEKRL